MLFSTKAEYGVRLMVELGRRAGAAEPENAHPVSLGAVAEAETLPLSYLEHLVAKLREAGLVGSVRGAHGGYRLSKPASEIAMIDVVEALEGPIAPMECFHVTARAASCARTRSMASTARRSCSGPASRAGCSGRLRAPRCPSWSSSRAARRPTIASPSRSPDDQRATSNGTDEGRKTNSWRRCHFLRSATCT